MPLLTGTSGHDVLNGTEGRDTLRGLGGDDILRGWSGNDILDGGPGADLMRGGVGDDVYYVDNSGDVAIENAGEGLDTVFSAISYRLRENVENLNLTGSAVRALGNALNNRLVGNSGNNILDGLGGADIMRGGAGDDIYYVDNSNDRVIELAGQGADIVYSMVSYALAANFEQLVLLGSTAVRANGNTTANRLVGNSANNILNGGQGADVMRGGLGNDRYYVDNDGDRAIENAGEGIDRVYSTINFTLGANVEQLFLRGSAAINGTGNNLDNVLLGNSADNILDGGAGEDRMRGGGGDDTYYVDNRGDEVFENAGQGTDRVFSTVTFTLGANVEDLTLAGAAAINGTGNSIDNVIVGNSENNILDGLLGADVMRGGLGDDHYYIDDAGDRAVESVGEGTDTVYSSVHFQLGLNVENLNLTGSGAINGTGNALDNRLVGNAADNMLNGGVGADTMRGGGGNDGYYVDNIADDAIENADEGLDTVYSSIALTLGANLENLTLTGSAAIAAAGNSLDNVLTGNAADNVLNGGGGDDTLDGGDGNDTLYGDDGINTLSGGTGNDSLHGYGDDTLHGGAGDDTFHVHGSEVTVSELAGQGIDTVIVYMTGDPSFTAYGLFDTVENGTLIDIFGGGTLVGNSLDNVLTGGIGNDQLNGGEGNDTLVGGAGDDKLVGASGDDSYYGGAGREQVSDGSGTDTFLYVDVSDSAFGSADDLRHLDSGDIIDFSAMDANATVDGNQDFFFFGTFYESQQNTPETIGQNYLTAAGTMWAVQIEGSLSTLVYLYGDVDGGGADFVVKLILDAEATLPALFGVFYSV